MSLTLTRTTMPAGTRFTERLKLAGSALLAMGRALRNRRAARHIADLPDALLSDIGLKRDDVHAALSADWRTDPTYLLALSASRRRRQR